MYIYILYEAKYRRYGEQRSCSVTDDCPFLAAMWSAECTGSGEKPQQVQQVGEPRSMRSGGAEGRGRNH